MVVLGLLATEMARAEEQALPRFAALVGDRINVRTGPGKQYPIRWIYARAGLPVKVVQEFDTWRKIEDHEGGQGWLHVSLLTSRRTAMVQGDIEPLYREADPGERILLRAEPGVIGKLTLCRAEFCEMEIDRARGWMARKALWGVLPDETWPP